MKVDKDQGSPGGVGETCPICHGRGSITVRDGDFNDSVRCDHSPTGTAASYVKPTPPPNPSTSDHIGDPMADTGRAPSPAGGVDVEGLSRWFALIPPGPYDALHRGTGEPLGGSWEVRQQDTDPANKHHWPFRLCESIAGQHAGCDEAVFSFIAGVLNAWPEIEAALSAQPGAETPPQPEPRWVEIDRLKREIGVRQARLQLLVLGDPTKSVGGSALPPPLDGGR
jgi:hypothetical protein